jgi:FtsP/CotA-like multicopper oxidase with cupredoxin domain
MKYLKILGLAAIAAMAFMSFAAGTASATKLYSTGVALGTGTEINATLSAGNSSYLKDGGTTLNTCTGGTVAGKIENAGGSAATVSGKTNTLSFTNCSSLVHTVSTGSLEVHHITGTTNGTVTASGAVLNNTIFGTSCLYESGAGKDLGTLSGNKLNINITVTEAEPKKFICPDTPTWTAEFTVTKPHALTVEAS